MRVIIAIPAFVRQTIEELDQLSFMKHSHYFSMFFNAASACVFFVFHFVSSKMAAPVVLTDSSGS
jgi:hypothetical protein